MAPEQYKVWCPDVGETDDDARLIKAFDAEYAAKAYVERSYHEEAFEQTMEVHVRCTFGGSDLRVFAITPEPTVYFSALDVTP